MTPVQTWEFVYPDICRCGHHLDDHGGWTSVDVLECNGHIFDGSGCPCEDFQPMVAA